MSQPFFHEGDPFSYEPGSNPIYEEVQGMVGQFVESNIDGLETKYGILAQHFFSEIKSGQLSDNLAIWEFLVYQARPIEAQINAWLDW